MSVALRDLSTRHLLAPSGENDQFPHGRKRLFEVALAGELTLTRLESIELLHRGDDHFRRVVEAVRDARSDISFELYQIRPDAIGRRMCGALAAAARRGVRVRLLLDRFGSSRIGSWVSDLRREGIEAIWYNPWGSRQHPLHRTHRKLLIIDGRLASVGGINFAAEFSEQCSGSRAWRDIGCWIRGSVVATLAAQFEAAWRANGGRPAATPSSDVESGAPCAVAGGRDGRHGHRAAIRSLLDHAETEVLLASPYFIPDHQLRRTLLSTAARGVRVVVTVPRLSDIPAFKHASRRLYKTLLAAGIEIRERCDRMVHAKVAVADGCLAAVGSANLNRQSLSNNSETMLLTTDRSAVTELRSLILSERADRVESLTDDSWARHPDRRWWAELAASPVGLVF